MAAHDHPIDPPGTVRLGPVLTVPSILRDLGVDPAAVLSEVGLELALFDDPDGVIPFAKRGELLEACVSWTGCEHFGILVGERAGLSSFGPVGFLVMHSPDTGSALRSLVHYLHLHVQGAAVSFAEGRLLAFLGYHVLEPQLRGRDQLEDAAVAVACRILRELCGTDWVPSSVHLAHAAPRDAEAYRRSFGAPVQFDSDRNGVYFASKWLSHPVPGANAELYRLLRRHIEALDIESVEGLPARVSRVLRTALLMHKASAEEVAALFSIHPRTLHRRLAECGTTFQELLNRERYETARQMLEDSNVALHDIAQVLDFSDASAFSRAFRRWSGTTPSEWRRIRLESRGRRRGRPETGPGDP